MASKDRRKPIENVAHYAFREGRRTDKTWDKSNAKALATGMDEAMDGHTSKADLRVAKVAQIDQKGRVVNVFANLYHAAAYIVDKKLHKRKKSGHSKSPTYGIYGNLTMMMKMGWNAYGYSWVPADRDAKVTWLRNADKVSGNSVQVVYKTKNGTLYFESIMAACRYYIKQFDITVTTYAVADRVRKAFVDGRAYLDKENGVSIRKEFA